MKEPLFAVIILLVSLCTCLDVPIKINLINPPAVVDNSFLSVSIDSSIVKNKFENIDLRSKKLIALANGLTGHENRAEFYLRIGGSDADHIEFDPTMYILNTTEFNELCEFVYKLRWKLIFDLNILERNSDGSWDPTNALELINYAIDKGYYVHYELGNEPDLFPRHLNITIPPEQLAHDFRTLRQILDDKTRRQSMLIGPDVATLHRYNYFENALANMEEGVLNAVTFHHYYSASDNITVYNFTSIEYLDTFIDYCQHALSIIEESFLTFPHPPVWIGETSSTYGGGSPGAGESFASGFVWLDKLGLAAQMNISVVVRQSLKGGHYSLLNKDYDPNPDYWSSLLYKQLVGRIVLNVTGYLQHERKVRIYAHCVNRFSRRGYKPLSLVLMVLNLDPTDTADIRLAVEGMEDLDADQYLFTPANDGLNDKLVKLNGNVLKMINDTALPELKPMRVRQPYKLPPFTYGYFVILDSYAAACEKVH